MVEYKAIVVGVGVTTVCLVGASFDGRLTRREVGLCGLLGVIPMAAAPMPGLMAMASTSPVSSGVGMGLSYASAIIAGAIVGLSALMGE